MGSSGMIVNVLALAYGLFAIYLMLNSYGIPDGTFVDNYIVLVEVLIVVGVGVVYMLVSGAHKKSNAPAGDAISK
jgi:hypothetical protein